MTAIGFVKEGKYLGARELRTNLAKVLKSRQSYFVTDHGKPVKATGGFFTTSTNLQNALCCWPFDGGVIMLTTEL